MKKSVIIMFSVGALLLVSSVSLFAKGEVGAGVFGIAVSAALVFFGFRKHSSNKRAAEEAERSRREEENRKREYDATHGKIECKVSGVTFKNDDGTSRQRVLSSLFREVGYDGGEQATLQAYEFEGRPAVYVLVGGKIVGNIPREYTSEVYPVALDNNYFAAVHVRRFRNEENKLIYNADLVIEYQK